MGIAHTVLGEHPVWGAYLDNLHVAHLPGSPPTKASFPMRNAVMSGYALATVVVEAAEQSGSRMQARLALQHGRHVFLMRSLLEHEWAPAPGGYARECCWCWRDVAEHRPWSD